MKRTLLTCLFSVVLLTAGGASSPQMPARDAISCPTVGLKSLAEATEAERLIQTALTILPERRLAFVSRYFLGRRYHPETKKRIKAQRTPKKEKTEADNPLPQPVLNLTTSFEYLDCMTYVEHVLALTNSERPSYTGAFLPRLIDVMFDAGGQTLRNHLRSHFTSHWAEVNERKGYLIDVARGHPLAVTREVTLNRVGKNRTFYVEDRFMIAPQPTTYAYFPLQVILDGKAPLQSGDVVALVCTKEGLDVTHMGFFIEQDGHRFLRHASITRNRIVDEDFVTYLRGKKELPGLMVFRPRLAAVPAPPVYRFVLTQTAKARP